MSRQYSLNLQDREELQQEMWMNVARRIHRFDARRGELAVYLATVVKNRGISALRLLGRMRQTCRGRVAMDAASEAKTPAHDQAVLLDVRDKVDQLPAELREVAGLLPDFDKTEVAKRLGISRATVNRRVLQLRKAFAEKS